MKLGAFFKSLIGVDGTDEGAALCGGFDFFRLIGVEDSKFVTAIGCILQLSGRDFHVMVMCI